MAFFQKKKREENLTADEALVKLEQFCAFRDRCSHEVSQKMRELKLDRDTCDTLFEALENDGFVDDDRFARMFALGKFRQNGWGRVRIKQELGMRAIKPGLIETALAEISEEDYTTALTDILEKKAGLYKDEKDGWQKLAQLAIRRGFEPGLVFEAIKVLKSNPHA